MLDISLLEAGKAALLGIVEGVTEFLPISSTGHLIVAGDLIGFTGDRAKAFEVFIQLGAILSVVWLYRRKIFPQMDTSDDLNFWKRWMNFWMKVLVSFLPAAVVGLLLHSFIKSHLFSVEVVAISLILGGIAILIIEHVVKGRARVGDVNQVNYRQAWWVGVAQVLALVPGVSRSGSTIMGGLLTGLDRKTAAEYSFFLAIPTMLAATLFDLYKSRGSIGGEGDVLLFGIGFVVAFLSALVAIKTFMRFISSHSFRGFAWYRIVFGGALLALLSMGVLR